MRFVKELRLPGANMNLRLVRNTEVPNHEDVALITIVRGVPPLVYGNAIDPLLLWIRMLGYRDIVEGHLDVTIVVERISQIIEILLFVQSQPK